MPAHSPEYIAEKVAQGHGMANLNDRAQLTGWTTPAARDWKDSAADISTRLDTGRERFDQLPRQAVLAGWPTPKTATGGANSNREARGLAGWPTPSTMDNGNTGSAWEERRERVKAENKNGNGFGMLLPMVTQLIGPARLTAHGTLLTGSGAGTVSGGQLNPDLSRWLMGLPEEWARSMPGWQDWQMWQVLTDLALNEPKPTE